ncbi:MULTISPECIES: carboxymuconolactone decarboxylase family protein [Rhizobium]|uniref:Peroxidase n=1 Tax=Rhizobium bangladeshense TaxID=1138189 RepID=A0ABS7LL15_9HYPH|nr:MULTISPECIES: carboxymuconolactone decarboxylase family protein [Rhizobium]MBX4871225.1 peroxidase [Rhizobium bangladeshense]MBX4874314.1 peroxidase [Rhizobium bangladeshense]MBX4887784.1 peroxidase [Rhizobium bangladeshense]MBX4890778.1 peroxidase [Rhizobium bangladeshense]MBX4894845.1 peroxidase [Rhizobium bangladeshense]
MAFIHTPDASASEKTSSMYASAEANYGYLPNMYRAFGHRPEVMESWVGLLSSIRNHMSLRRYELVTLAAAKELKSSYCMLAHGSVLLREGFTNDGLTAVVNETQRAPIDACERAIMAFAAKVARDATSITQQDIDGLKKHGLSDAEIFDVTAATAARCFFSKMLDALGAAPDHAYIERLEPNVRRALSVGREVERPLVPSPASGASQ